MPTAQARVRLPLPETPKPMQGKAHVKRVRLDESNIGNKFQGPTGKFKKGNPGGPGAPLAAGMAKHRSWWLQCVNQADVVKLYRTVTRLALLGDAPHVKIWLERSLGKVPQMIQLQEMEPADLNEDPGAGRYL